MKENLQEWLNSPVPETELEHKDSSPDIVYQPIWVIEKLLDEMTQNNWSRTDHKYSFHSDKEGVEWLATSHTLNFCNDAGEQRVLLCSSFINPMEYQETSNLLHTGIAEATKAGVKVLGDRFGKSLNSRTILKEKKTPVKSKAVPDARILKAYHKAITDNDQETIDRLVKIYDIKEKEVAGA